MQSAIKSTPVRTPTKTTEVQISEIFMDSYQRKINPSKVQKICEDFNLHRMRPIEISQRDGTFWCFDGQHRLEVYKHLGIKRIPANIHFGLTYEDEALLFAMQHVNEQHISKRDEWKALCEARAPLARMITRTCREFNFEVGGDTKDGKSIGAIREVLKIAERHGEQGLRDVLFVLRAAFEHDPSSAHHDIVAGMCKLLDTYPKLSDFHYNRFVQVLKKTSPRILLKKSMTERGRGGKQVAKAIVLEYNKGLGRDNKLRLNENLIH